MKRQFTFLHLYRKINVILNYVGFVNSSVLFIIHIVCISILFSKLLQKFLLCYKHETSFYRI